MSEPLSKIPSGMRYYVDEEARLRRTIEDTVMSVFAGWSYQEITTPTVDYYSLFEHAMGRSESHRAFRFTDTDGRLLALRPDVTSSIARAAATLFSERKRPLRLCYAASVFRQQPQSRAEWTRELTQTGCELVGPNTTLANTEVLMIAAEVLRRLEPHQSYVITLNEVEIFNGIAERLSLDLKSREEMRKLVEARNGSDLASFLAPLAAEEDCRAFTELTHLSGKRDVLEKARVVIKNERSRAGLDNLEQLWDVIEAINLTDFFEIDLGDLSRLDYYTGLTFKMYVEGAGKNVGSGGRYDGLTASFGKAEPAVGFVLDLDALTAVLLERSNGSNVYSNEEPVTHDITARQATAAFLEAIERRKRNERVLIDFSEVPPCLN